MGKFAIVICIIATFQFQLIASEKTLIEQFALIARNTANADFLEPIATIDGKTFYTQLDPVQTWQQAKLTCILNGMELATISSSAQYQAIKTSNVTEGVFWTAARDRLDLSQFVWDYPEEDLAEDLNYLRTSSDTYLTGLTLTKVLTFPLLPPIFGLTSMPLDSEFGVLCEL